MAQQAADAVMRAYRVAGFTWGVLAWNFGDTDWKWRFWYQNLRIAFDHILMLWGQYSGQPMVQKIHTIIIMIWWLEIGFLSIFSHVGWKMIDFDAVFMPQGVNFTSQRGIGFIHGGYDFTMTENSWRSWGWEDAAGHEARTPKSHENVGIWGSTGIMALEYPWIFHFQEKTIPAGCVILRRFICSDQFWQGDILMTLILQQLQIEWQKAINLFS